MKVNTEGSFVYLAAAFVVAFLVLAIVPVWFILGTTGGQDHEHHGGGETVTEEWFMARVNGQQDKYGSSDGSVRPPPGSKVYIMVRQFAFIPHTVRLRAGERYDLTFYSPDVLHGPSLIQKVSLNAVVMPMMTSTVGIQPTQRGEILLICSEYCGIAHHLIKGKIIVE
jgi:cytochrome c oxidase subunit 2